MKTIEDLALEASKDTMHVLIDSKFGNPQYNSVEASWPALVHFAKRLIEAWQAQQSQELVPFPALTGGIVNHKELGELYDRLQVQQYAVKYAMLFLAPPAIPECMCLVPKEPSEAIRNALRTGSRKDYPSDELCNIRWAAAIAQGGK